jgi:uncharacterized membrane protein YsdA (DUF1294 family)
MVNGKWSKVWSYALTALFFTGVAASLVAGLIPVDIFVIYLAVSLLTFVVYFIDKSAARKGLWRIKESTLHLFSLCCGWPGALVAQQALRHKTQKENFRFVFWITVILNMALFSWVHTVDGAKALKGVVLAMHDLFAAIKIKVMAFI